jgi:uncharacterized protein (DUF1697 family)
MRNEKLRGVFENLGFANIQTVISSGNVQFESNSKDVKAMEESIEEAWPKQLGFSSTTIIRSRDELLDLVTKDPFRGVEHSQKNYLLVTFFKDHPKTDFKFPYQPEGRAYKLLGVYDRTICSVIDLTSAKTPDLMTWLERQFGKNLTSRTWKTVQRILQKMG